MPVHDWTRVSAGTFHDFHSAWITSLRTAFNQGVLPSRFYALAEQAAGDIGPDVLTLMAESENGDAGDDLLFSKDAPSAVALETAPPQVRFALRTEKELYALKQKRLTIRHSSNDQIVALVELISPGNKESQAHFEQLILKAKEALRQGIHLLIVDLFPPTARDPEGIPAELWDYLDGTRLELPADKRLTLSAYNAGPVKKAYIEPVAVGDRLIDMPLFLHPRWYVRVPLESTYQTAWAGVPLKYRHILEAAH